MPCFPWRNPAEEVDSGAPGRGLRSRRLLHRRRNNILVRSADAVIAVGGSWGTLSEIALARRAGIPVIALGGWRISDAAGRQVPGITLVDTPEQAVAVFARLTELLATAQREPGQRPPS